MKKLVVLSGAGMSAESGLRTFRDMGGLWEEYDVMEVASIEGWFKNPELVLKFYNERRRQLNDVEPNKGHTGLAELEKYFDVQIITQNVDNLHERAGSTKIIHLHGELTKISSTGNPSYVKDIGMAELKMGDLCPDGHQLRPHIVWFGEAVPAIEESVPHCMEADIFVVIGTSLNVYPAAGLINYVPNGVPIYLIDPNEIDAYVSKTYEHIKLGAEEGVAELAKKILD
jgi:NAD-dependent deacetylase